MSSEALAPCGTHLREKISRRDTTLPDPTKPRFGEKAKFLPVCFVISVIVALWTTYTFCHCLPLLELPESYDEGKSCFVIVNVLSFFIVTCYLRSMLQHPGTIPDESALEQGDTSWEYAPQDGKAPVRDAPVLARIFAKDMDLQEQKERKRLGDRRSCKWCNKYKPDRCHHCRVCRMCILKMDHHCPWIYNCVGFNNFKYFFLLIMYSSAASNFIVVSMWKDVVRVSSDPSIPFITMFFTLFGETLAALVAFVLTAFFVFHTHLMLKAMTTIEFCEKSRSRTFNTEVYDLGLVGNIKSVLGDDMLLWLLPISPPSGDGMTFLSKEVTSSVLVTDSPSAPSPGSSARGTRSMMPMYGSLPMKQSGMQSGTGEAPDPAEMPSFSRRPELVYQGY